IGISLENQRLIVEVAAPNYTTAMLGGEPQADLHPQNSVTLQDPSNWKWLVRVSFGLVEIERVMRLGATVQVLAELLPAARKVLNYVFRRIGEV
ncbi:hypothetical protein MTO96_044989, partial [Rhipicephalus appendiculatus]